MTEDGGRGSRGWAAASVLPLAALAILGFLALRDRQYLLIDDSYIAFRYAENLAHGAGLTWNPGERVEGYTNLLWVLVLAVMAKVRLDLAVASAALSFVFGATTVVLVTRLSRKVDPDAGEWTHAVPGLLLATNPSVDNAATSGMESSLFGFLVVLATILLVRGRDVPRLRAWATLAYVLAYFTRPEGALVCGVALAVEALAAHGTPREKLRVVLGVGTFDEKGRESLVLAENKHFDVVGREP